MNAALQLGASRPRFRENGKACYGRALPLRNKGNADFVPAKEPFVSSRAIQLSTLLSAAHPATQHSTFNCPHEDPPRTSRRLESQHLFMKSIPCSLLVCLAASAISLLAQEPVPPGKIAAVDSKMGKPVPDFMAFREELNAQSLSPEQRIAALDEWKKINGSPLAALRQQRPATPMLTPEARADLLASQKKAALAAAKTPEERELTELQWEVADAIREMREEKVSPEKHIAMFDEFSRVNREVFQDIRALRKMIGERQRGATPPLVPSPPRSETEARLHATRDAILRELDARKDALAKLTAEERIAAKDRDRAFYQESMNALRENSKETAAILRNQNNELHSR